MPRFFYGTIPTLAWILNHFFYGGVHYAWLAEEFNPLRTNPKSSNPYLIYGDLYWAWSHRDTFDKFVAQSREGLSKGVWTQSLRGVIDHALARRLTSVCDDAPVDLFYPLVYRVEMSAIAEERRVVAGSALTADSRECLVPDLREEEFELLFADNGFDATFRRLVLDERSGERRTPPEGVLLTLEGRRT